jgi:hypothetical protein
MTFRRPRCISALPNWLLILLLVGVLARVIVFRGAVPVLWPDSYAYLKSAEDMAYKGNYWMHEVYRTPIYPLFLSQFLMTPPNPVLTGRLIMAAQQLCGLLSGLLLFLTLRRAFSERVALWGSILFLISPLQLYYEVCILTEAQFILLLALFLWLAGRQIEDVSQHRVSYLLCFTVGLAAAVLSLSRPIGQLLLVASWGFCVLRFGVRKRTIYGAMIAGGVFIVSVFPWMKLNHDRYGFWGISRDFGINMFHRVLDVSNTPLPPHSSDAFVRQIYLEAKPSPRPTYFRVYHELRRTLKREGTPKHLVSVAVDQRMGDFALEVLRAHPYDFIPQSLVHVWRLFADPRPSLHFCEGEDAKPYLCSNHPGVRFPSVASDPRRVGRTSKRRVFYLLNVLRIPDLCVSALAFLGLAVGFRGARSEQRLFLAFTVAYFVGLAAVFNTPEDRFRLPVDGLLLAFAVVGVAFIYRRIACRIFTLNRPNL